MASVEAATSSRWGPIAGFVLVASANQMLWLNFTPITSGAATRLGVSQSDIGVLSEIFPLFYVFLAIPAGRALDRWFRSSLLAGAGLTALGAVIRVVDHRYAVILVGQILISLGQPTVLNAVTGTATRYLSAGHRPVGIAVGSAGTFVGFIAAFVLGAAFGATGLHTILSISAVYAVVALAVLALFLRAPGRDPVGLTTGTDVSARAFRNLWDDRVLRLLSGLVFLGFGAFVALATWAETLLKPAGVDASTTDTLLTFMVVAGVVGCVLVPPLAAARRWQAQVLLASALATMACCALMAAAPGVVTGAVALPLFGLFLLPDLPVVLELADARAGKAAGTATAILWLAGNAGGIVVALVVQGLQSHPTAAFAVLGVGGVVVVPLTIRLRSSLSGRRSPTHGY